MSEFGDLKDLVLLFWLLLMLLVVWFVIVCGPATIIRYAHVHVTGVFARTAAV